MLCCVVGLRSEIILQPDLQSSLDLCRLDTAPVLHTVLVWSSVAGKKYPRQSPPFVFIKTAALTSKYRCHQLTSFCWIQPTLGLAWTQELQLLLHTTRGYSYSNKYQLTSFSLEWK